MQKKLFLIFVRRWSVFQNPVTFHSPLSLTAVKITKLMDERTCLLQLLKRIKQQLCPLMWLCAVILQLKYYSMDYFSYFSCRIIACNHIKGHSSCFILFSSCSKQVWSSISFRTYTMRITIVIPAVNGSVTSSKPLQLPANCYAIFSLVLPLYVTRVYVFYKVYRHVLRKCC